MMYFKSICLVIMILFASAVHAQDNNLVVKTPQNLDDVLERKLSLDKKRLANNQYTIQIFSGNYEMAKVFLDSFSNAFPNRYAKLSFETPNYKIRVGKFATRLEGIQTLDTVRVKFPEAFLLKPWVYLFEFFLDSNLDISFNCISDFDVVIVFDLQSAIIALSNLFHVILKSL